MFDVRLRDKLLFEDSHFTYSRRYFWAYNTLGVINEGIKSMRAAYLTTFTKDFWAGRHLTLWPHPQPDSAEGRDYAARMDVLRQELESAVGELQGMFEKNETTRTEIRSLREQLFSGSSVKESRRAIEQGDNIKILTSVSMIFLPLTFVVVSDPLLFFPLFLSLFPFSFPCPSTFSEPTSPLFPSPLFISLYHFTHLALFLPTSPDHLPVPHYPYPTPLFSLPLTPFTLSSRTPFPKQQSLPSDLKSNEDTKCRASSA